MNKFTIKRFVTGFRTEENEANGDWQVGEEFETMTSNRVQVLVSTAHADGYDILLGVAEVDLMKDSLDFAVRFFKKWMLEQEATAEDVKLLKKRIIAAGTYGGNICRD